MDNERQLELIDGDNKNESVTQQETDQQDIEGMNEVGQEHKGVDEVRQEYEGQRNKYAQLVLERYDMGKRVEQLDEQIQEAKTLLIALEFALDKLESKSEDSDNG